MSEEKVKESEPTAPPAPATQQIQQSIESNVARFFSNLTIMQVFTV
jgi:hypothetical protein